MCIGNLRKIAVIIFLVLVQQVVSYCQDSSSVKNLFLLDSKKVQVNTFYCTLSPFSSWSSANQQSYNALQIEGGLIINFK